MDRRGFLLTTLALGGCATIGARHSGAGPNPLEELEPIYSFRADIEGLTLEVASRGCTVRPDFVSFVERHGSAVTVAFARRTVEACRGGSVGRVPLVFTWAELGLAAATPVFVLNPLRGPR